MRNRTFPEFFEYLTEGDETSLSNSLFGPPEFALAVIVTLAIAVLHYRRSLASLQKESGETYRSLAGTIANFVMALGWGLLIIVLFRK